MAGWRECWQRRRADAGAIGVIVLFFVCFFPHVLFGDRFIIAGDALYYSYPLRTVVWRMIRHGEWPLWTPLVLSGYPLLSMAQVAVAYPLTWVYLFLRGPWAEQICVLAPFLLAPAFTYAYAREIGRSRLASLFAGLTFGYGGMMCGFIANSGLLTNSLMWTPLVLLFVDRARQRALARCLLWATLAYTMSVLAGHGQSYVYIGVLALAYGLFLSLASSFGRRDGRSEWTSWRPLFVAVGAVFLSAGVAAFQLFEIMRAARRSSRSALTYEGFGEGSFTLREALLSIGAPLYHYVDTSAYLAPLAVLLAVVAIAGALRGRTAHDARLWFWFLIAIIAFVLMLGTHTPLYHLVYRVPVLNSFRVPSRHTFEWTLALSIIAAYGWDATAAFFARRRDMRTGTRRFDLAIGAALVALGIVVGIFWWRATFTPPKPNPSIYTALPETFYWLWKFAFTVIIISLFVWCFRMSAWRTRTVLLAGTVVLACFVEQSATIACWWGERLSLPASRLQLVSPTTRYLQHLPSAENRIYTRVGLFSEEFNPHPRLEAPNLTAVYGLQNVAGMEPLILERYSRALGGVGPDSVTPRAGFPTHNDDLFSARSHVLDLLNATYVVSFTNLKTFEEPFVYHDGIGVSAIDLDLSLSPGATARLTGSSMDADSVALVSSLANSIEVNEGEPVARVRLHMTDGRVIERDLRAGLETAEWAHERGDVRTLMKHKLADVFDSRAGDAAGSFSANHYWAKLALDAPEQIESIEITNVTRGASLAVWRASVYNSHTGRSVALAIDTRSEFWTTVIDYDGVQVLHNARALPRAWLVTEAEAVDGEEALRRIRGESVHSLDPRRTALLEVQPNQLPTLPGGEVSAASSAHIVEYEANRLRIETNAPTSTVLVLSEIFYPGWKATVDGQPSEILLADYLLRGLALPAGPHKIEMRYTAPAAFNGAMISGLTLCVIVGLAIYTRLKSKA